MKTQIRLHRSASSLEAYPCSLIWVFTGGRSLQSDQILHWRHIHAVWSESSLEAHPCSLIRFFTGGTSMQSDLSLHWRHIRAVWSESSLEAHPCSLIRFFTGGTSVQSDLSLHWRHICAVWSESSLEAHPCSLISIVTGHFLVAKDPKHLEVDSKDLSACAGWSESLLGTHSLEGNAVPGLFFWPWPLNYNNHNPMTVIIHINFWLIYYTDRLWQVWYHLLQKVLYHPPQNSCCHSCISCEITGCVII